MSIRHGSAAAARRVVPRSAGELSSTASQKRVRPPPRSASPTTLPDCLSRLRYGIQLAAITKDTAEAATYLRLAIRAVSPAVRRLSRRF